MRTALIYILICCEFFSIQAQKLSGSESPYIWAGDSTITLTANSINSGKTFDVFIISETGDKMKVSFDFISKIVKVSDYSERVIYADTIASGVSAFLTIDSKAEENRNISPYVYCNDNPIYLVDFDGMRPTAYEAALMAAYVYKDKFAADYAKELKELKWIPSSHKTSISKNYTAFWQNGLQSELFEKTVDGITEYVYVYAGTNSIEDVFEDVLQVAGLAPQYYTAINNAVSLSNELKGHELTFVGHSLGGGEAAAASMATNLSAITFNPATVSPLTVSGSSKKIVNYIFTGKKVGIGNLRFGGDPLNNAQNNFFFSAPGRAIPIDIGYKLSHTIKDFLDKKLPEP